MSEQDQHIDRDGLQRPGASMPEISQETESFEVISMCIEPGDADVSFLYNGNDLRKHVPGLNLFISGGVDTNAGRRVEALEKVVVKMWNVQKGYGFIRFADGTEQFIHSSNVATGCHPAHGLLEGWMPSLSTNHRPGEVEVEKGDVLWTKKQAIGPGKTPSKTELTWALTQKAQEDLVAGTHELEATLSERMEHYDRVREIQRAWAEELQKDPPEDITQLVSLPEWLTGVSHQWDDKTVLISDTYNRSELTIDETGTPVFRRYLTVTTSGKNQPSATIKTVIRGWGVVSPVTDEKELQLEYSDEHSSLQMSVQCGGARRSMPISTTVEAPYLEPTNGQIRQRVVGNDHWGNSHEVVRTVCVFDRSPMIHHIWIHEQNRVLGDYPADEVRSSQLVYAVAEKSRDMHLDEVETDLPQPHVKSLSVGEAVGWFYAAGYTDTDYLGGWVEAVERRLSAAVVRIALDGVPEETKYTSEEAWEIRLNEWLADSFDPAEITDRITGAFLEKYHPSWSHIYDNWKGLTEEQRMMFTLTYPELDAKIQGMARYLDLLKNRPVAN